MATPTRRSALIIIVIFVALTASPCVAQDSQINIVYQYGAAYAPIIVMKEKKFLESVLGSTKVSYRILASGSSIRDGMIAGQIQIGVVGVAPFLIGWDRGVGWRVASNICNIPFNLMVMRENIKSLHDIAPDDKISVPAPDSTQAILVAMASGYQLGNAKALNTNLVAQPLPLGEQALLTQQVAGQVAVPPFTQDELAHGAHSLFDSVKNIDGHGHGVLSGLFVVVMPAWAKANPKEYQAIVQSLKMSIAFIKANPRGAAELIALDEHMPDKAGFYLDALTKAGLDYTYVPSGISAFAEAMKASGVLSAIPSWRDVVMPNLLESAGS